MIPGDISSIYSEWESDRLEGPKSRGEGAAGQAAPRGWRSREQGSGSWEGYRQAAASSQNEAEESDEAEDDWAGERTTRVGRHDREVA